MTPREPPRGRRPGRAIDLTHPIRSSMPVYGADPKPALLPWTRAALHGYESEVLHAGTHTGTHMDAPFHFMPGAAPIDAVPLDRCIAPGALLDVRGCHPPEFIDRAALERAEAALGRRLAPGDAALLWTGWSDLWHDPLYASIHPGLSQEGAGFLVERGAALVGIDAMSVDDPREQAFPAHRALLGAGILIVENLAFLASLADAGPFTFAALPLPIVGASGSPVRALAIIQQ